jgi:hypothetical protein
MNQRTVQIIAVTVIVAMIGAFAVGLVFGGGGSGDGTSPGDQDGRTGQPQDAQDASVLAGPHVEVQLCAGVACPRRDAAEEEELHAEVESDPRVRLALLITSEQHYELFLEEFGDRQDLVDQVDPDTVPSLLQVYLRDPDDAPAVLSWLLDEDGVADAWVIPTDTP